MSRRAWAAYRSDGVPCPDNHPSPAHAEACLRFRQKVERRERSGARERGDGPGPWAGGRVDEVFTVVEPEPWPVGCQVLTVIAVVLVVLGWLSTT